MKEIERCLIVFLGEIKDRNYRAILLQTYIAQEGPLSEEAAAKARKLLEAPDA